MPHLTHTERFNEGFWKSATRKASSRTSCGGCRFYETKWASMNRKYKLVLLASLFLILAACVPGNSLPGVYLVTEGPTWYPSLTPITTPTPTLVPTDTPPPPTYTPVVIPTPDIVNAFCQDDSSQPWSCSCGDYIRNPLAR
jgi:hypothetical protein